VAIKTKQQKTKNWLRAHSQDEFVKKSQQDGYRSRAAYKLEEIAINHQLFKNLTNILDLGCAPGSWSQLAMNNTKKSVIVGVDLLEIKHMDNNNSKNNIFHFIKGDFTDPEIKCEILNKFSQYNSKGVELILSDMAPNLTGNANIDQSRVEDLAIQVIEYAQENLSINGACLIKLFHGMHFNNVLKYANSIFKQVKTIKPKASRDKSKECYLLMQP
jgi:23S rRNA (uridine2552-2'-O)-methyltransferase